VFPKPGKNLLFGPISSLQKRGLSEKNPSGKGGLFFRPAREIFPFRKIWPSLRKAAFWGDAKKIPGGEGRGGKPQNLG